MEMAGWCFNAAYTYWQIWWVCFEIHFAVVEGKKKTRFNLRNEQQNIWYEGVTDDNTTCWVHNHPYSVLEHCVCLLQLFCSCGWGIKFVLLLMHAHNNKLKKNLECTHTHNIMTQQWLYKHPHTYSRTYFLVLMQGWWLTESTSRIVNTFQRIQLWWMMLLMLGQLWNIWPVAPTPRTKMTPKGDIPSYHTPGQRNEWIQCCMTYAGVGRGNTLADLNKQHTTKPAWLAVVNTGNCKTIRWKLVGKI